jgi:transcriptional regulator with XRE-family HTH domain
MLSDQDRIRLRTAIEGANLSQAKIAVLLGISKQLLTHWLQGRREPSEKQLRNLAQVLGVDMTFLDGTLGHPLAGAGAGLDTLEAAKWNFRVAPEDGGRDYGNANVLAFTPDINTLVRELGQNGLDQGLRGMGAMQIRFALIELRSGSPAYAAFMRALRWDELLPHIDATIDLNSRLSAKLRRGKQALEKLLLLRVDDFTTTGAHGEERTSDEPGSRSPFAALMRDNLNSSKETNIAGGTHGAGKATAWQCSELSTVLLSSRIAPSYLRTGQPEEGLRFIAKSELTWHQWPVHDGGPRAGPGWLARPDDTNSLWVPADHLSPLFLDRLSLPDGVDRSAASGTSLLIVGFRDPQEDEKTDPGAILARIQQALAENFFPAIVDERMVVTVEHLVDGERRKSEVVNPAKYVPEMVEAYRAHRRGEVVPEGEAAPGDTAHAQVQHLIPATRPDASPSLQPHDDVDTKSDLVVRFAKPEELGPMGAERRQLVNHVALVRGRLMVVEYLRRSNLVVGGRPFHAILLAGEAAGDGPAQQAAEQFFRQSEPAAHHKWIWREDVRDNYRPGAKQCLNEFYQRLNDKLRDMIKPEEDAEDDGPEELRKLLFLAGPTRAVSLAVLRLSDQVLEDGRWVIKGEIVVNDRKRRLIVTPRLAVLPESGGTIDLGWERLEVTRAIRGAPSVTEEKEIKVPAGTTRLQFAAVSDRAVDGLDLNRCRVTVRVLARPDLVQEQPFAPMVVAEEEA